MANPSELERGDPVAAACPTCSSTGFYGVTWDASAGRHVDAPCSLCGGTGTRPTESEFHGPATRFCTNCCGLGHLVDPDGLAQSRPCPTCNATGKVARQHDQNRPAPPIGCGSCANLFAEIRVLTAERETWRDQARQLGAEVAELRRPFGRLEPMPAIEDADA